MAQPVTLTAGQVAALVAISFDEVPPRGAADDSPGPARWSDDDVAGLVDAGLAREGRDRVQLTRQGRCWAGGRR